MKSLAEYIIERGPAPKVEFSKKSICLLDTDPTNYDDNSIDDVDGQIEADYNDFMEKGRLEDVQALKELKKNTHNIMILTIEN